MKQAFQIIPLTVEARGDIITNNLPEFREFVREALGNINRDLKTDEDFDQAEIDVKSLKQAEDTVRAAALAAFDDKLKELVEGLNETAEEIRAPRLEIEKLIEKRKTEVKADLIKQAMAMLNCSERLRQSAFGKSVADAIKGKRTMESMGKALDITVRIHNAMVDKNRDAIASFVKAHGEEMLPDREELEVKSFDSVEDELRRRFEAKKAIEERNRLEAEAAKAKAEAQVAIREADAAKNQAPSNKLNPHNLPDPPKIGTIPTGSKVVPFRAENPPPGVAISVEDEWKQMTATVIAAFGLIKEHRERLTHSSNEERVAAFGSGVNALWKQINAKVEVAQ